MHRLWLTPLLSEPADGDLCYVRAASSVYYPYLCVYDKANAVFNAMSTNISILLVDTLKFSPLP